MKSSPLLRVLFLLLTLMLPTLVRADVDGFKGMRWGSSLPDLLVTKKLVLTKDGGAKGSSLYSLENEELRYGKATLTGIHCSFTQERFNGVILLFKGAKNFAAMKTEAFAKFGESQKIEQGNEEIYNWVGKITNSVLSYNRSTQSGFLFMKPKKMPPPVKIADKRKTTSPVDQGTAPGRAVPPKIAAPPSKTSPVDMETALDRAPPVPQEAPAGAISLEAQGLIDRDQALTRLCWDTVGPAADAACVQMRENIERLRGMGWCMAPGEPGRSGTEVVWQRCGSQGTATPPPPPQATSQAPFQPMPQMPPEAIPPAIPQAVPLVGAEKNQQCRQIGELFAAAAQMRDNGVEPQAAEEELVWRANSQAPEITIERIRETVELVYFDSVYAQTWGEQLAQQVSDRCLSGRGPFGQPLP